jgi:hypothetical protein
MEKIISYGKKAVLFIAMLTLANLILDLLGQSITDWVYRPGQKLGLVKKGSE